jgi:hypothetical protein
MVVLMEHLAVQVVAVAALVVGLLAAAAVVVLVVVLLVVIMQMVFQAEKEPVAALEALHLAQLILLIPLLEWD